MGSAPTMPRLHGARSLQRCHHRLRSAGRVEQLVAASRIPACRVRATGTDRQNGGRKGSVAETTAWVFDRGLQSASFLGQSDLLATNRNTFVCWSAQSGYPRKLKAYGRFDRRLECPFRTSCRCVWCSAKRLGAFGICESPA